MIRKKLGKTQWKSDHVNKKTKQKSNHVKKKQSRDKVKTDQQNCEEYNKSHRQSNYKKCTQLMGSPKL